jgi:stalled ribosome rescue protein Dom34
VTSHRNAAVWLDHKEAKIFHVDLESVDASKLEVPHRHLHRHLKAAGDAHEHPDELRRFFGEIAGGLDDAERVLVVGPSTAKLQFLKYVHAHDPKLEPKIVGVETVDHPTDGQLLAFIKRYFAVPPPRIR